MLSLNHKKLDAWKLGIELVTIIYEITEHFPKSETYGITNQLRRAAVSVPSNIAEGAARSSPPDRRRFYQIARSSLVEIDTQIEITLRLGFSNDNNLSELDEKMNHLFAVLSKLIQATAKA